ncbi:hypothetical protein SAMN04488115_101387 [Bosea lathyri]|uniref:Uncharacterized protein n=1 Tax=Bosea lathyri TaxID=1036778 RepID=A0A1H5SRV4_9HYPH|nr:hypothetical protein SAMN04488115_101387 [Bosea lathyri]
MPPSSATTPMARRPEVDRIVPSEVSTPPGLRAAKARGRAPARTSLPEVVTLPPLKVIRPSRSAITPMALSVPLVVTMTPVALTLPPPEAAMPGLSRPTVAMDPRFKVAVEPPSTRIP